LKISDLVLHLADYFEIEHVELQLRINVNLIADLSLCILDQDYEALVDCVLEVDVAGVAYEQIDLRLVIS
jgi:hypothetical protein